MTPFTIFRSLLVKSLAVILPCFAVVYQASARDFIEIATPYFTVVSALSESETRGLIEQMRVFQSSVRDLTTIRDLRPQVPLRIYLIGSYEWDKYLAGHTGVEGLTFPRPLSMTIVLDGQSWMKASRILFHEYVHFAIRNGRTGTYPRWLDEGLAELLSTDEIGMQKLKLGTPPRDRLVDPNEFGDERWIPLRKVIDNESQRTSDDEWHQHEDELSFYAESWALVHYLIFTLPGGGKAVINYAHLRERGVAVDDAFSQAFNMTIEQMEENLKHYVHGGRFPNLSIDISKLSLLTFGDLTARQMSTTESTLELGKVISLVNHQNLVPYFEKFAKSEPKSGLALTGKATALAFNKKIDEAQSVLNQVLASKPSDPEIFIMAGEIQNLDAATKKGESDRSERDRLRRKAFEFHDAALKEPYNGFGEMEIVTEYANSALEFDGNLDRALMQVEHIRKTYPNESRTAAVHAKLLVAKNRLKEARDAWSVAADYGGGRLRIEALDAIEQIDAQLHGK